MVLEILAPYCHILGRLYGIAHIESLISEKVIILVKEKSMLTLDKLETNHLMGSLQKNSNGFLNIQYLQSNSTKLNNLGEGTIKIVSGKSETLNQNRTVKGSIRLYENFTCDSHIKNQRN